MKHFVPMFCLAAAVAVTAQTAPKAPAASTAPKAAAASATKTAAGSAAAGFPSVYKVPAGEKRAVSPQKKVAVLTYQDIKVGTGPEGESGKLWHVKYKGWRAADGIVFDSWENNKRPAMGPDGKPQMGPDNKPKMGDPEPLVFPQGMGRLIPGFDYGVVGMHVGGKRRLFIPWQMAYGTRAMPDRPDHPGIPAKSDLIFDVELVEVTDMPAPPQRPMMPPPGGGSVRPQPVVPPKPGTTPPQGTAPVTGQPVSPDATKPNTPPPAPNTNPGAAPQPGQPAPQPQTTPPPQPK